LRFLLLAGSAAKVEPLGALEAFLSAKVYVRAALSSAEVPRPQ